MTGSRPAGGADDGPPPELLQRARAALWAEHAADPRPVAVGEGTLSERYHEELEEEVLALAPDPSPALCLATWAQHLRRWEVPRDAHPPGRAGYLRWRKAAARHQAAAARRVLAGCGVSPALCDAVARLVGKRGGGPDAQALEDAACLRFLARDLAGFAGGRDPEAVAQVLARTWRKMSAGAQDQARGRLGQLPQGLRDLVASVVGPA